jgi:hypothetical protein
MNADLNDRLDDIFGDAPRTAGNFPTGDAAPTQGRRELSPDLKRAAETGGFFQQCPKCRGTGRFGNYGRCFACAGKGGKTFKTSPAKRAHNRELAEDRKVKRTQDSWAAFRDRQPKLAEWIITRQESFPFAAAMRDAVLKWGDLTDKQAAAVERCIASDAAKAQERVARAASAPAIDVSKIEQAFATARERAARPGAMGIWTKPLLLQANDTALAVTPGSAGSQWEGMLFVKTRDGRKLGYVKAGKFNKRFECTPAEEAAVLTACGDPATAAVAYGKAWSVCSVCHRTLTNDGSIERGIGPICAERFGF